MYKNCIGFGFVALAGIVFCASTRADDQSDWLKARQAEYATWAAAHPNVEAQIADLKGKTQALVDAYKARP